MNNATADLQIQTILENKKIPYADIIMYEKHEPIYRYLHHASGKECLAMFSITKLLTVTSAMRLIEEKKLALYDPVEKYIPEFADAFLLDANGNKVRPKNRMTVFNLMTMTGGLDYNLHKTSIKRAVEKSGGKADTQTLVKSFIEEPLSFEPGTRFAYSLCHDVLAAIIEICAGMKFSSYVQKNILDPLGMTHSGFNFDDKCVHELYSFSNGEVIPASKKNPFRLSENYESGGAGFYGTVEDYALFADALACGGKAYNGYRILKPETLEMMRQDHTGVLCLKNPFTCIQGDEYAYGLGVRTRLKDTEWGLAKGEFGWDGAAGSYVMLDPDKEISVFVGMNLLNWHEMFREHIEIVKALYINM